MIKSLRRLLHLAPAPARISGDEARVFLDTSPAPVEEIRPPQASNDDPLNDLREGLERELRVAGLIR